MKNDQDSGQTGGAKKFLYKKNGGRGALFGDEDEAVPQFNFQPQVENKKPLLNLDDVWSIRNNVNAGKIGGMNMPAARDFDRTVEASLYSRYNRGAAGNQRGPNEPSLNSRLGNMDSKPIGTQNQNSLNHNTTNHNFNHSLQNKNFQNHASHPAGQSFQNQNLHRQRTGFMHRDSKRGVDFDPINSARTSASRRPSADAMTAQPAFLHAPQRDAMSFTSSVLSPSGIHFGETTPNDIQSVATPRTTRTDASSMTSNQSAVFGGQNRGRNNIDDYEFDF